jgi:mannose-6-phosphate isomerase-like protein (cupin superfamily)
VIEGFFRIRVGDDLFEMKPGDRLYIPAGTRHSAEVVGRRTVVALDGIRW